ncbi:MAG: hypothetical protein HeimC3_12920 [Candidatus Heimdallarchaeota archaeon LC_3]|nr:MAG: hypothetical protein HeimC3_16030 [Candidatus Heimdallarchaeota archaeon LC_3]OLS26018.1 MAG: hypothetical protein HeimC3_12920 [Candidatus Heimdallarchaeota archaeon LC_3]
MRLTIQKLNGAIFRDLPNFKYFPFSCKYCTFWEFTFFDNNTSLEDAEQYKQYCIELLNKNGYNYGFLAFWDKEPIGYTQYSQISYFPRLTHFVSFQFSSDSIFLSCLYIPNKDYRRLGVGKKLLEMIQKDLENTNFKFIETLVKANDQEDPFSDWLNRPKEFFLENGFQIINEKDNVLHLRKEIANRMSL